MQNRVYTSNVLALQSTALYYDTDQENIIWNITFTVKFVINLKFIIKYKDVDCRK